ncbi:MAG: glycosyltransferase, partial [Nitrososphaerales archaeon]|nr:glycosyltransferase [Nitrososphaerales archaeon]
ITFLYGPRYFAPLRYLVLSLRTLILLTVRRPDVVYAQNPPVFCPLVSLLYCRAAGVRLAIDHHSVWKVKTFGGFAGRMIGFLESFVARSASLNTVPHRIWGRELASVGVGRILVVHDFVKRNPFGREQAVRNRYAATPVIAIASHGGHPLERLEAEAGAASGVRGLTLLFTGPPSKIANRLQNLPANVRYLGLLPMDEYQRLKASCDFAVNITDEPYTLSHVIFEFVASSLPVVSSRQQVVEETFGDSLSYADESSPRRVAAALSRLAEDPNLLMEYRSRVSRLYDKLLERRESETRDLNRSLSS